MGMKNVEPNASALNNPEWHLNSSSGRFHMGMNPMVMFSGPIQSAQMFHVWSSIHFLSA